MIVVPNLLFDSFVILSDDCRSHHSVGAAGNFCTIRAQLRPRDYILASFIFRAFVR